MQLGSPFDPANTFCFTSGNHLLDLWQGWFQIWRSHGRKAVRTAELESNGDYQALIMCFFGSV
jgi:hypothetical protein